MAACRSLVNRLSERGRIETGLALEERTEMGLVLKTETVGYLLNGK